MYVVKKKKKRDFFLFKLIYRTNLGIIIIMVFQNIATVKEARAHTRTLKRKKVDVECKHSKIYF